MKKKKFFLFAVFVLLIAGVVTVVANLSGINRQYIDKENKIVAATLELNSIFSPDDSESVFAVKLNEMTEYFLSNKINTAIISFNNCNVTAGNITGFENSFSNALFADDGDVFKMIKKQLEKSGIQIILEIDCTDMSAEYLDNTIAEINKKYAFAGVLITNYNQNNSYLQTIKMNINKRWKDYYFGIRLKDYNTAKEIQNFGAVDFYIFDSVSQNEYRNLKNNDFAKETVLIDHNSASFASDIFLLSNFGGYDGVVLTEYTNPDTDLSFYHNIMDSSQKLKEFKFAVDNTFNVIYPSKNIETYDKSIYITGTAQPLQSVWVNGNEIITAADGTFGYYIELAKGENLIEVQQAENYISRIVNRKSYTGSYSSSNKKQSDETVKAKNGQIIQTTGPLTSLLALPDEDSGIIDGIQQGVQMVVKKSVKTVRDNKYTWAYELSNGAYILAQDVEWINKSDYTESHFSDMYIEKLENGDEYLVLKVTGKPAVISYPADDAVMFEIMDSKLADDFSVTMREDNNVTLDSVFGNDYFVEQTNNSVYITLNNTGTELWGYNIEYHQDNTVKIYLKNAPHKMNGAKPLTGVSVVLDAGHGGKDPGALPLYGANGPGEQDINLAIAIATKDCLEKFGATVTLTRSDDSYLTLQQRRDITNSTKPDLFISIHHNSMDYSVNGSEMYGVESYYYTPQSKPMAEIMSESISSVTGRQNRGHYFGRYYVLRNDIAPGVLNEYGFVMNPYEYSNLYSDENIYKAAIGTAMAVLEMIPE